MVAIKHTIAHQSGIPLGGIGTGSVEIWPDGYFHEWQIFNIGKWAPRQPGHGEKKEPSMDPAGLTFFLRVKDDEKGVVMRRLGIRTDQHDLYSLAWLKSVKGIDFEGRFPVAKLAYIDDTLPVDVSCKMLAPFMPHDSRVSGTPGFYAIFKVTNKSSKPVDVALMGILANPIAVDLKDRKLVNTMSKCGDATILTMRTAATKGFAATHGSMSFSVSGGEASWIAAEFEQYFKDFRLGSENTHISVFHQWRVAGRLWNLGDGVKNPARLAKYFPKGKSEAEKRRLLDDLTKYAFARDLMERYCETGVDLKTASEADVDKILMQFTEFFFNQIIFNKARPSWGHGALAASCTIKPGESKDIAFILSWHFPNHYSQKGEIIGHMYENWFRDAEDVNKFLIEKRETLVSKTEAFANALFDTSLPPSLAEAWAAQLTTIPKCTWWVKNGDFGVWEGLGCCGFHTTDITYQGSFNLLALFPDLQMRQMLMGARFQREDGRIPHFFVPDLSHVDHGFDRVDMNQQFVMLVCRDYLWTGDTKYLKEAWPHVVRAMDNTQLLDGDGDGLPDHDTRRNTYDGWNFFGTPSYIASLWLGALRAAARMARDIGDKANETKWEAFLAKAVPAFVDKLWNGEYFSLWIDKDRRDEMCMTDQLSGEWFTRLVGLGNSIPVDRVKAALAAVFKHNFSAEGGLINGSYPAGKKRSFPAHYNGQAMATWTGIEYAIGSMMIDHGMVSEGIAVVDAIHDRYERAGRYWNHVECGDHYYRAMCSWAVLLAATGFKLDVPKQAMRIAPCTSGDVRAPWFSSTAWGTFSWKGDKLEIECLAGKHVLADLVLDRNPASAFATISGKAIKIKVATGEDGVHVAFDAPVELDAGSSLVI
ncbi:MAG: GH116 family glycosyl hydrolase [Candidatus Sigynarchaeota archaeon]